MSQPKANPVQHYSPEWKSLEVGEIKKILD